MYLVIAFILEIKEEGKENRPKTKAKHRKQHRTDSKSEHPCDQCDFAATTAGNLKHHKESVHDGVR